MIYSYDRASYKLKLEPLITLYCNTCKRIILFLHLDSLLTIDIIVQSSYKELIKFKVHIASISNIFQAFKLKILVLLLLHPRSLLNRKLFIHLLIHLYISFINIITYLINIYLLKVISLNNKFTIIITNYLCFISLLTNVFKSIDSLIIKIY
jgi:hypothetical protein